MSSNSSSHDTAPSAPLAAPTLFILGTECGWEEEQLVAAAQKQGHNAEILRIDELELRLTEGGTQLIHHPSEGPTAGDFVPSQNLTKKDPDSLERDLTESFKSGRLIIRRTRGNRDKMMALTLLAEQWQVPFTDSFGSVATNLNKRIFMPAFQVKTIRQIPTVFWHTPEAAPTDRTATPPQRRTSQSRPHPTPPFDFPILVKEACGRHGEGIEILRSPDDWKAFVERVSGRKTQSRESTENSSKSRPSSTDFMIQPFLDIEAEYRILVVGGQALGAVQKIPEAGSAIANYAAGAQFLKAELPSEILDESIQLCAQQGIDIGGVDLAQVGTVYRLLEVNRCPEFKAFQTATEVNVAEHLIDWFTNK